MKTFIFIAIGFIVFSILLWRRWVEKQRDKTARKAIESGQDIIAEWVYPSDMLTKVNEYHFDVSSPISTKVLISNNSFLIKNKSFSLFKSFNGHDSDGKIVTNCSYIENAQLLKFRLRYILYDSNGGKSYDKETYLIHVPSEFEDKAKEVVKYFEEWIFANAKEVNNVLPDNVPLSINFDDDY